MPLHTVDQHDDDNETAAVYATDLSMRTLPRRRMPDTAVPRRWPMRRYPVPYAVSTVVFLIYGYLAMVLS